MTDTAAHFADKLLNGQALVEAAVTLDLDGLTIAIRSNSEVLLESLGGYFAHALGAGDADIEVIAIEAEAQDFGLTFQDWAREPGKTGRKDAYVDLEDGRVIQKVRTGMVFLQSAEHSIAYGPCVANDNQVINFVMAQHMNWLQQNGALICHAAGLVRNGRCLGLAGFSGGGKSTLMLKLLDDESSHYLTNDRLFLRSGDADVTAIGIAKLPRINPGTIINNATLRSMFDEERIAGLEALPAHELWELEEKYDVDVESVYGLGKVVPAAPLKAFMILNWDRKSTEPCSFTQVDLNERQDLLSAVIKSPGPFYQFKEGGFFQDTMPLEAGPYLEALQGVEIWEVQGGVDFEAAAQQCIEILGDSHG